MIKVTVELISAIDGHHEILGEAIIHNDTTGSKTRGNYRAIFSRRGGLTATRGNVYRNAAVFDFPRQRLNAWHLLHRALENALK